MDKQLPAFSDSLDLVLSAKPHNASFTTTREGGSAGSDGITAGATAFTQRGVIRCLAKLLLNMPVKNTTRQGKPILTK